MPVRRAVAVVTGEVLAPRLAGPAIRARQIAIALAAEHDVTLVSTVACSLAVPGVRMLAADGAALRQAVAGAEILVVQGDVVARAGLLDDTRAVVVVDLYDPFHLEVLEQTRHLDRHARRLAVWSAARVLDEQLRRGDRFLCAGGRQRDLWVGHLAAAGRVNERTYDPDPELASLLLDVPFGVDDHPPVASGPVLRGVVPGIGPDDHVVLWGGGIYEWFDPLTLLHAVDRLRVRLPTVRVLFAGARHPNPAVGETPMAAATRALADRLGLTGIHVFFHDWVPYDERAGYLLEADVGVSTHAEHLETAYSFRTRVLDYLWASLPVVTTRGDELGAAVERAGAGLTVPPGDADALADALGRLLEDPVLRDRARAAASDLAAASRWSRVLEPLVAFCREPTRAPDLLDADVRAAIVDPGGPFPGGRPSARVRRQLGRVRRGEWRSLAERAGLRRRRPPG